MEKLIYISSKTFLKHFWLDILDLRIAHAHSASRWQSRTQMSECSGDEESDRQDRPQTPWNRLQEILVVSTTPPTANANATPEVWSVCSLQERKWTVHCRQTLSCLPKQIFLWFRREAWSPDAHTNRSTKDKAPKQETATDPVLQKLTQTLSDGQSNSKMYTLMRGLNSALEFSCLYMMELSSKVRRL